jgi:4-amino-4-deoxy-L-arabinose transferase-like glycosyltransferase
VTNLSIRFRVFGPAALCLALGAGFLPLAGVQNDEALFGAPYYQPNAAQYCVTIFHKRIVLMVMSYIGTLKTAFYGPIFSVFGTNAWSVRLPMVLFGALTVLFFYYLVQRSCGSKAALLGAVLLATDPAFLLTDTFDWGPVAIEHFCLVTGCFLVLRSVQEKGGVSDSMRDLGLGFFVFGLGLWNKAIFGWALAGLAVAVVVVFWPEFKKMVTVKMVTIAGISFLFGALPFLTYNLRHPFNTLRQNAHQESPGSVLPKLRMLAGTLDGSGLFGFLAAEDWADNPKAAGAVPAFIHNHLGERMHSGMTFAVLLAMLMVPWWWRSRAARFALVFVVTDWAIMALTKDAGGAIHHTVLMWPMPIFFVVATFGVPWRRLAGIGGCLLVLMNLLVVNEYFYKFERNGAAGNFTDALYPLSAALTDAPRPVYVIDWGMQNTLALFHQGRLDLHAGDYPFVNDHPSEFEQKVIGVMFSAPDSLFISHVRSREVFRGVRDQFDRTAAQAGKGEQLVETVADSNGRPIFEIFRLVPVPNRP